MHKALSLSLALIALAGCPKDQGTDTGTGGGLAPASLTVALRAAPGAAADVSLSDLAVVRVGGASEVLEAGPIVAHLPADGTAVALLTADVDADEIEALSFTVDGDPVEVPVVPDGAMISLTVDGATRTFRAD